MRTASGRSRVCVLACVDFPTHRRIMRIPSGILRSAALGVCTDALCATRHEELDGFCPEHLLEGVATPEVVKWLVDVGLFISTTVDGETGFSIWNYSEHNETKAQIEQRLEVGRERKVSDCLREAVLIACRGICGICGEILGSDPIHIDHIVPVSKGGATEFENLQAAHARCNLRKGARQS
jgi:hypothetical protein